MWIQGSCPFWWPGYLRCGFWDLPLYYRSQNRCSMASQLCQKLAKVVGRVLPGQFLQPFDDVAVVLRALIVKRWFWCGCQFAGPAHRYAVIAYQFFGYLLLGGRSQPFMGKTGASKAANPSRGRRISFWGANSPHTFFCFCTSDTSKPLYLAIPTLFASLYGMNIPLPYAQTETALWGLLGLSGAMISVVFLLLRRMRWFWSRTWGLRASPGSWILMAIEFFPFVRGIKKFLNCPPLPVSLLN